MPVKPPSDGSTPLTASDMRNYESLPKVLAPGYHLRDIPKGVIGEISKISEELEELKDASYQHDKVMILCELADIYGAMEAFLTKYYPGMEMDDIIKHSDTTKRAFASGRRK